MACEICGANNECHKIQILLVIPIIGIYPTPLDPEDITPEEQVLIDKWEDRYDNYLGLFRTLKRSQDRILGGIYESIIHPRKYVEVSHPASPNVNGAANWFFTDRLIKPSENATIEEKADWAENKIQNLRLTYDLRGWATCSALGELSDRNFTIVSGGE